MVNKTNSRLRSVQTRLLIVLILTSTLPLLGMSIYFAWADANNKREYIEQSQLDFAEVASSEISTFFQELRDDAAMIASLPTITHGTPEERQILLEQIFQNYNRYGQLAFVDPKSGDILQAGRGRPTETVNISHIQSYQGARRGKQSWTIAPPPLGGALILHMHTPILRDGKLIGVLGSPLPIQPFRDLINQVVVHNDADAQVADQNGIIFLDTLRTPHPEGDEPIWIYMDRLEDNPIPSGKFVGSATGVDELVVYRRIPELSWTVIIKQPLAKILASSRYGRDLTLLGAVGMALLSIFFAYLFSHSITRPISLLTTALQAFGRGNTSQTFNTPSGGIYEYKALVGAFDSMRRTVRDREARLAKTELENQSILSAIPDSICQLDLSGRITTQKLKAPFDAILQAHGNGSDSIFKILQRIAVGEQEYVPWEELTARVHAEQTVTMAYHIQLPHGKLHFECRLAVEKGGGYLVIMSDVTERKVAEALLQRSKVAAEDANRAKSAFLSHVTHELRTPMNGVLGMTSLLYDTNLNQEQLELVNNVRRSGDTMLTIINDILDFSKIEASKFDLEKVVFDIRSCIEEAFDLVMTNASEKELALVYDIDETVPPWLVQDVTRLRQILVNLLSNAVKFTEVGGVEILVTAEVLTDVQKRIHFWVRDTGIGIPPERLDRLFHSFSQVDNSTARRYGGTGLGLVISKRLCEMMGGTIAVESETNVGSTFRFSIVVETWPETQPHLETEDNLLDSKQIVVVDDNPLSQRFIYNNLEKWGASVILAASPKGVNDALEQYPNPDALIWVCPVETEEDLEKVDSIKTASPELPFILCAYHKNRLTKQRPLPSIKTLSKPLKPASLLNSLLDNDDQESTSHSVEHQILPDPQSVNLPPMKILLAEDNIVNQKVARRILQRYGFHADVAANGLEVLESIERQPYDVILMDVQMPEMDGLMATQEIRKNQAIAKQPYIVALTANVMNPDREMYLSKGMSDFVSKPIRVPELLDAFQRAAASIHAQNLPKESPVIDVSSTADEYAYENGHNSNHVLQEDKPHHYQLAIYDGSQHQNGEQPKHTNGIHSATANVHLIYVSGGAHLPEKLLFNGQSSYRIGRQQGLCELLLDDRRVSRLHSVISLSDGKFYIQDKGSAGGTYINYRKLKVDDAQRLRHNDIINFNEIEYRFISNDS